MEETKRQLVRLCEEHPEGLSIWQLQKLYLSTYSKPLVLAGSTRLSVLEEHLRKMSEHLHCSSTGGLTVWPLLAPEPPALIVLSSPSSSSSSSSSPSPSPSREYASARGKGSLSQTSNTAFPLQKLKEEMMAMLANVPSGVEVSKLRSQYKQLYGRPLTLAEYGLGRLKDLLLALGDSVCVERQEKKNVLRLKSLPALDQSQQGLLAKRRIRGRGGEEEERGDLQPSQTVTVTRTTALSPAMEKERDLRDLLDLLEQSPEGIPLKVLAVAFGQRYRRNLTLSRIGYSSMAALVDALGDQVLVRGQQVFHRTHHPPGTSLAPTPPRSGSPAGLDPPWSLFSFGAGPGRVKSTTPPCSRPSSRSGPPPPPSFCHYGPPSNAGGSPQPARTCSGPSLYGSTPVSLQFGDQPPVKLPQPSAPASFPAQAPSPAPCPSPQPPQPAPTTPKQSFPASDFPALERDVGPVRSQEKRQRSGTRSPGKAQVFTAAYHAQLRQVHGANVRAAEALGEEEGDGKRRRRRTNLDADTVNSLVGDVVRDLAAEGELVTQDGVVTRVCQLMQVSSLEAGGITRWQLPALKELQRSIREVNMFIQSLEAASSVCTLYEVGGALASLKDKRRYEELNLGPLCKLPLIHRMFKIDCNTRDDDIVPIETVDILRSLREFRRKNHSQQVDPAAFMKHMADQYDSDSPYKLGIRICSMGLPISTLSKVQILEQSLLEKARQTVLLELQEELMQRTRKLKKNLLDTADALHSSSSLGTSELRRKYAAMTAAEAVMEVLKSAATVCRPPTAQHILKFLAEMSRDPVAPALFQLAICGASLAAPPGLAPRADPAPKRKAEEAQSRDAPSGPPPSEAKVKQLLRDGLSCQASSLTLAQLASLETKLTAHFQVAHFSWLQQGTFLEFLVKQIQVLQETVGGAVSLGSSGDQGCGFRPSRQDVFEFIRQCSTVTAVTHPDGLSHIESALRAHYGVQDSGDLGLGSLLSLVGLFQRQQGLGMAGGLSPVCYQAALFSNEPRGEVVVGRLGEVSQAQALASLLSCPLLEDLGQWSLWELVFRPLHGPLSDFIDKHAANTDLAALEVTPGSLLRVTTSTGDKFFSQAAMTLDPVGTAGHLVSMVVADGIRNAPTALLANHMESSLASAVARVDVSLSEEDDDACFGTVTRFLLDCLVRIPTRTCQALLHQVFLEPLSRVLGQAKSKSVLLRSARSDPRCLNRLHHLGIVLGITEWARDYQDKLTAPQSPSRPDSVTEDPREGTPVQSGSFSPTPPDTREEEVAPEAPVDYSANSSHPEQNQDEAEEEESYELTSVPNGHAHDAKHTPGDMEERTLDAETPLAENEGTEGSSSQSDTDTVNYQKAVIDDIRKSEFGIGVELNAEGQRLMMVHQERLGRSLDRLSTELYSKDTHFVLELIQNADDNSYQPQGGAVAALAFLVDRACITVLNNETGFQEKNVRAICDVGRSTKGKHKHGYIGQKGIGFKSVFKVSDRPEIHSNGFHLRFDKTSGPMGYILPQWVEDQSPLDPPLAGPLAQHSWTTKILLPLRPENQQTRTLFHDIHPSLLLFLHRLRSIVILNPSEKRVVTMTRRDLSHNILEVEHSDGTERWLVVKRTLHPTKVREDVESTELALAFQLKRDDTGSDITALPQKQPVFAFLPLRSFGFRFIIQGDFDIPSSREDVDRDSSWNQWLRSEIPQLLLHALGVFTDHPEFSGLSGLCHFLQFVPLLDEVLDFFKPVAGKIIQLLKGKAFLPTLRKDGVVEYKLPSQVAVCQDAVIRDVIGGEELDRHLSLAYLHPGLQPAPPLSLLTHLGVRHLRGSDVTTVTTAMAQELVQGEGINSAQGLHALARLLVCNFRALQQGYGDADAILQALRELPIIPLADGRVVALGREKVFFPMDDKTSKKTSNTQTGYLGVLHGDVSVVQPGLLSCVEPLERQQVRELLKRLGVHHLEPRHLLQQHIYPALKSHAWKSKPEAVVVSYLVFIKQHSPCSQEFSDPDTAVPVLTSRGLLCPRQDRVHFSKEYGNEDLPKTLPGCEWVLLSDCYVQTDGDVAGWRDLFSRLGVRDRLIIRKERRTLSAKELASSPWAVESALGPCGAGGPEGGYVLDDYPSEEFLSLATAQLPAPTLLEQRRALLELLHSHWDTGDQYSQYLTAQVIDSEGRPIKETKSSFSHFLSRLPWVPAYRLQRDGGKEVEYLCPNSVYLFSPKVHSLLGTHVCYVDMQSSDMTNALGMRQTLSVEEVIGYVKKWCVKSKPTIGPEEQEEESEGSEFTSAPEHIHNVYTFLHRNCPPSRLKELFLHNPAIFIEYKRGEEWCSGRFYHLKEVCWSDPTAMFVRYQSLTRGPASPLQEPRVLAPFYGPLEGMRDLFTRLLAVEPSPSMLQYVGLLELVCSSTPLATGDILKDVSVLYAALGEKCKTTRAGDLEHIPQINPSYCSTLKGMLLDKRVFPTKDNTWVSLASRPMVADSRELEKIFKPYREVCLLSLPASDKKAPRTGPLHVRSVVFSEENRALFLEACGVPRLSQQVSTEAQTENFRPCPALQALVASVVPYVQRFLYHHEEMSELYPELLESNIAQTLRQLSYGQVGKLYTRYLLSLADEEAPIVEMTDVICMLKDRKEFYIQKDHLSAKLDICRELATLFSTETNHRKELAHFLSGLMTSLNDPAALKRFLLKEDIRDLPENEAVWEVPQPVEAKPEPVFPGGPQAVRAPEEAPRPRQETGEQVLNHWPPRSSLSNAPSNSSERQGTGPLEAVLRMWPPPPGPGDAGREPPPGRCSGEGSDGAPGPFLGQRSTDRPADGNHNLPPRDHTHASHQGAVATSGTSGPGVKRESGVESEPNTDSGSHRTTGRGEPSVEPERERTSGARTQTNLAGSGATRRGSDPDQTSLRNPPDSILVPDAVVSSVFHGAGGVGDCGQRPPLAMDSPVWGKSQQTHPLLEDLELTCQRPTTVVFSEEPRDLDSIGAWGERLVFSFLTHWRDGDAPGRPAHITWSNQNGESGQPYDFKMTFDPPAEEGGEEGEGGGMTREVFVEVKATVKKEKAFIHLSANELDFALREKERYQVFRVYNAGDAQNVRLCRIQNLAQHLHTKDLQLFLFV